MYFKNKLQTAKASPAGLVHMYSPHCQRRLAVSVKIRSPTTLNLKAPETWYAILIVNLPPAIREL